MFLLNTELYFNFIKNDAKLPLTSSEFIGQIVIIIFTVSNPEILFTNRNVCTSPDIPNSNLSYVVSVLSELTYNKPTDMTCRFEFWWLYNLKHFLMMRRGLLINRRCYYHCFAWGNVSG